jgi:hypothetical protein
MYITTHAATHLATDLAAQRLNGAGIECCLPLAIAHLALDLADL